MNFARLWTRRQLSSQIAAVVATTVVVCAGLIVAAMQLFEIYEQVRLLDSLNPAARRALEALIAGRDPVYADFRELVRVQAPLNADAESRSNIALVVMTFAAAGLAFLVGRMLLGRIARGLENVALAARSVARGDLTARAHAIGWSSIEELELIDDFNAMAQALESAERELRDSTAAIAHELRTPLTVLSGRLQGIRDGVFEAGPDQIENLIRQVEGLVRIVDDLRTLTLAESGQPLLHYEPIDAADVVRSLVAVMRPDLDAAGLEVALDLVPCPMIGDATRIRQALVAVLHNAIRYAPGSGRLTVATRMERGGVVLAVRDNGPGLPPEAEARAFERFWRAEQSRARVSGGSGLGLSVVRAIVLAHHGQVSFRSRPEGGALFEMVLPAVPPATSAAPGR